MIDQTNEDRAARGADILDYYMDQHPDYFDDIIRTQVALTDMLADLRHACEADGLDFYNAVLVSEIHYNEERGE